jgi:hypothetical protein
LEFHFSLSTDIFWAFSKLVEEQEAPAIIFADFLRMKEEQEAKNE